MNDADRFDQLCTWLGDLPAGAQLRWGSPQLLPTFPFAVDWADLSLPAFEGAEDGEWTLEAYPRPEGLAAAPTRLGMVVPYDVQVRVTVNRATRQLISAVLIDSLGRHHHVRGRDVARILDGAGVLHSDDRAVTYVRQMWSVPALQRGLAMWIVAHTDRTDLVPAWDAAAGQVGRDEAEQQLRDAGYYPLGNDLYLAPEALDELFRVDSAKALRFLDEMSESNGENDSGRIERGPSDD